LDDCSNSHSILGDFETGTYRDIERFMQEAKKAGIWLIARPGPYISQFTSFFFSRVVTLFSDAETTGGGFPGWVGNIAGAWSRMNRNRELKSLQALSELTTQIILKVRFLRLHEDRKF
jgi:beta-galactosidase GanA